MTSTAAIRDKIFKSWSGISEVALIKEVATKGEHIQMCIEYWARKHKMPASEYEFFFHDVVQSYVQRLLSERLVCKAENVLRNVQRDVRCFYYQFACESDNAELRELLLDYLRQRDPHDFSQYMQEMQFEWDLLQQLQACPAVLERFRPQLRRVQLEALVSRDAAFHNRLITELYSANRNSALLPRLNKYAFWEYLVETQNVAEITRWCFLSTSAPTPESTAGLECLSELEQLFSAWTVEAKMYEHALKMLLTSGEVLRNAFARAGFFFADELSNDEQGAAVRRRLRRVCTTESFGSNREMLEKLQLASFLLRHSNYYPLTLQSFVAVRELEELAEYNSEHSELLKLVVTLKDNELHERAGFEKVAQGAKTYLESREVDFQSDQPLVTFYEFLATRNEPSIASLQCFLMSSALKHIPYLKSLAHRLETSSSGGVNGNANRSKLPNPYDLLRKFKGIDFVKLSQRMQPSSASFSDEHLCQRYARKYTISCTHYLKQHRSAYAVYYLLTEQLTHYAQITQTQLFRACEAVTELALQHAAVNADLVTHCIAFCEMLGFDTQQLRCFLKLSRDALPADSVASFGQLVEQVEGVLAQRLQAQPASFPLAEYQALLHMVACQPLQQQQWPHLILRHYASADDWWQLIVLLQYFEMPLTVLKELSVYFRTRALGQHLLRALSSDPPPPPGNERGGSGKRRASFSRQLKMMSRKAETNQSTTSAETMTSSMSSCHELTRMTSNSEQLGFMLDTSASTSSVDLFAIILLSAGSTAEERVGSAAKFLEIMESSAHPTSTSTNLLRNSIKYQLPVLAKLAATISPLNADWSWIVWLAVATDQWSAVIQHLAARDLQELQWRLIANAVLQGCTAILYRSFCIFFENNPLLHLFRCLHLTQHCHNLSEEVVLELRLYLLAWSNNEVALPLGLPVPRDQLMLASIRLLLVHLQHGFDSTLQQHKFIGCICRSDISDISGQLDFCRLNEVFTIMQSSGAVIVGWAQRFPLDFERLLQNETAEYEQLLDGLLTAQQFDVAVRLASLLHMPIADIVYKKWVAGLDAPSGVQQFESVRYEDEVDEHSLPPEILVDFFLYAAATRLEQEWTRLYLLYKRALNVIKRHHLLANESFDRDHIECLMILSYLKIEDADAAAALPIYHSEYFETIMLNERCTLYKSFLELKELAGIEELNVARRSVLTEPMQRRLEALLNRLLDEGDIVEALRLQELFECRPIDLRFVVFCMALAEGVTTVSSMSSEERQLLRFIEKSSFAKFNRRTLDSLRSSQSQSAYLSPLKTANSSSGGGGGDFSDSSSTTMEFEEIPSKEKRETLDIIQGIASKLKCGVDIGKRIVMSYRAAMYLDKEYLDVLRTKDVSVLLKSVAEEECLHRLLVVSDILTSTRTSPQEIADMLSLEIATAVVRPRFYIFSAADDLQARNTFQNADLWGYNIDRDLHLFLELAPSTTKLGTRLLDYCDALKAYRKFQDNKPYEHSAAFERVAEIIARYGLPTTGGANGGGGFAPAASVFTTPPSPLPQVLSHKKQNLIYVELLIKAHQCFVHECSMEGIANILHRTKTLNAQLTQSKSWSLIVRLLIGIARYREMFYCFDALIDNDQFESLLGQFDEEKTIGLRQAILAYLREYRPDSNREYLKLAALHFLMYKDLAEMWEQDAADVLGKVLHNALLAGGQLPEQSSMNSAICARSTRVQIPKLRVSMEHVALLHQALENYTHATENYLLDNKLLLAQKSASMAELVAMQIDLANRALGKGSASMTTTGTLLQTTPPYCCVCVLTVKKRDEFRELVNAELSVPQTLILSHAFGYDINWAEALLSQFIILQRSAYLNEYLAYLPINDDIIDNIVKSFQLYAQHNKTSVQVMESLARLVDLVKSVTLKYKLASVLSLKATVMSLINEQTCSYLRDTNYGRSEKRNMPDIC